MADLQSTQSAIPSPDGAFIATIERSRLLVRSSADARIVQSYDLPSGFANSCRFIRWYHALGASSGMLRKVRKGTNSEILHEHRLILADDDKIIVYDVESSQAFAEITGATSLTKLANVEFALNPNEILVFSDFGWKLQIWSLLTKRAIEVKDPKLLPACYSYRPTTGHLAMLTRPEARDILMIIAPHNYEVVAALELPTTDACGIKYSPDGNWLAVWDTASAGCRVLILTADGHLFKTHELPQHELNLGVKCVEWSPTGDYLAIGDSEGKVMLLGKNTSSGRIRYRYIDLLSRVIAQYLRVPSKHVFYSNLQLYAIAGNEILTRFQFTQRLTFSHSFTIDNPKGTVWQEELGVSRSRGYTEAKRPAESPSLDSFPNAKGISSGISIMEFNLDGTLLASRDSATPSTLCIYAPKSGQLLTTLIHHAPIKSIQWHPKLADLLFMQCVISGPTVYVWRASWNTPKIFSLSMKAPFGQTRSWWLSSTSDSIKFMIGNTEQYVIGQFTQCGEDTSLQLLGESLDGLGPEDMFDEGNSLDLSPVKAMHGYEVDTPALGLSTQLGYASAVEDTFQYRQQNQAAT
ncbi:MAG: hypothetical protein Q9170_007167 [Blastenia crenularia]